MSKINNFTKDPSDLGAQKKFIIILPKLSLRVTFKVTGHLKWCAWITNKIWRLLVLDQYCTWKNQRCFHVAGLLYLSILLKKGFGFYNSQLQMGKNETGHIIYFIHMKKIKYIMYNVQDKGCSTGYRKEKNIFYFHKEVPSRGKCLYNNTRIMRN